MVAMAPSAADSVGVASPPDIAPTTTAKIRTSGKTYTTTDRQLCQVKWCSIGVDGAKAGVNCTRAMMYATNATDNIRPGTMPPISNFEIEIPERLPSSTVSAEGGMSMSTAPIAIIGPAAMMG